MGIAACVSRLLALQSVAGSLKFGTGFGSSLTQLSLQLTFPKCSARAQPSAVSAHCCVAKPQASSYITLGH